ANGRPVRSSEGQHFRVSVLRDITERKRHEASLRRQAALLDLSPDAIFVKRLKEGTITYWSRGAESLYGWTAKEAVGANANELLQARWAVPEAEVLESLRQTGKWAGELTHLTKSGSRVYVESRWQQMAGRGEEGAEILESNIDITERKRGEEALREARDALVEANTTLEQRVIERTRSLQETTEELNAFCYTIAHDLRSPLRTQLGFSKVLIEDFGDKLGEEGKMMAEHIANAAERQGLLISDLLAHARVSREEMPLSNVFLPDIVKLALTDIAMEIVEKKGLVDQTGLGAEQVRAHTSSLQLVVLNLLTNALKFVAAGSQPSIKVWSEAREGRVRLWVEDNGIGIEPQDMEKLFGMFQRLHSAKTYPGTGMGLAIVKKAVQRMGGELGVESEVGKGSKFWVELPVPESASAQPKGNEDSERAVR
ncbi:MAG TPA: ATP-binding protein, partial [Candidatus Dormibacteraeota bacterium]|nr:ATP-binding protein [Candidatus Dormibacteraeota bacterium]